MRTVTVRHASPADIDRIRDIYTHYVLNSTTTFEISMPDTQEMLSRLLKIQNASCPYLVCEVDNEIAGYAYASPYRPREAYRFTVEASIYLSTEFQGMGLGTALLNALSQHCVEQGFRHMVSVVTGDAGGPSYKFHLRNGFAYCGTLKNIGYKFERAIDTHFFQKAI
ncbi:GNAT family N-acetyltransferase [Rouxiella sp. Mn2063]|uniref:GNAT family N-acetyltransferase n=1 Tax=Rouxiella sp. Mn2063 TaxID=3395262 RepID=UPI003BC32B40